MSVANNVWNGCRVDDLKLLDAAHDMYRGSQVFIFYNAFTAGFYDFPSIFNAGDHSPILRLAHKFTIASWHRIFPSIYQGTKKFRAATQTIEKRGNQQRSGAAVKAWLSK